MTKFYVGFVSFLIALAYGMPAHAAASKKPAYLAHFEWRDGKKLKLVINTERHRPVAKIFSSKGEVLASCDVKTIADGIDLSCVSSGFSPLTSHATIFIGERQGKKAAILRFGTWLSGYEQTMLAVQIDRFKTIELAKR